MSSDKDILGSLIRNNGALSTCAKELRMTSLAIKKRMALSPELQEAYSEVTQELVDLAMLALKEKLKAEDPDPKLIMYTLDRLGQDAGFKKQSVINVNGTINAQQVNKSFDISSLSTDEKRLLVKAAKKQINEETYKSIPVDIVPEEDLPKKRTYSFIEAEEVNDDTERTEPEGS